MTIEPPAPDNGNTPNTPAVNYLKFDLPPIPAEVLETITCPDIRELVVSTVEILDDVIKRLAEDATGHDAEQFQEAEIGRYAKFLRGLSELNQQMARNGIKLAMVLREIMLSPLPYTDADRLKMIRQTQNHIKKHMSLALLMNRKNDKYRYHLYPAESFQVCNGLQVWDTFEADFNAVMAGHPVPEFTVQAVAIFEYATQARRVSRLERIPAFLRVAIAEKLATIAQRARPYLDDLQGLFEEFKNDQEEDSDDWWKRGDQPPDTPATDI